MTQFNRMAPRHAPHLGPASERGPTGDTHILDRTLRSLGRIAQAPVSIGNGSQPLCRAAVEAVAEHLAADWAILALRPEAVPYVSTRLVARDRAGRIHLGRRQLPARIRYRLGRALLGAQAVRIGDREAFVPLQVGDTTLGVLGALQDRAPPGGPQPETDSLDVDDVSRRVLTIIASQVSISLRSDHALRQGEQLLARAEDLHEKAAPRAVSLAESNRDPPEARTSLDLARRLRLTEHERDLLARELHDSVTQHVLAAGMAIDWCRAEVPAGSAVNEHLQHAKRLTRTAVEQLRSLIEALGDHRVDAEQDLPGMLCQLQTFRTAKHFDLSVHVVGDRVPLTATATHSLFRIASECLFNAAAHAGGRQAVIRLEYGNDTLQLSVADDGSGQPQVLREILRRELPGTGGGYHRGLVDIGARVAELGGTLDLERSHLGGIRAEVVVPLALVADRCWAEHRREAR